MKANVGPAKEGVSLLAVPRVEPLHERLVGCQMTEVNHIEHQERVHEDRVRSLPHVEGLV